MGKNGTFMALSGLPNRTELFTVLGIESSCDDTGGMSYFLSRGHHLSHHYYVPHFFKPFSFSVLLTSLHSAAVSCFFLLLLFHACNPKEKKRYTLFLFIFF
jgi:hypothetical protein